MRQEKRNKSKPRPTPKRTLEQTHEEFELTQKIDGVPGYSFSGINVGIKDKSLDLGCIHSEFPAHAAAVFTQNSFVGAPIVVGRNHIKSQTIQTVVVNSKNANVYTHQKGIDDTLKICNQIKKEFKLDSTEQVFPSSTGVIGHYLPVDKIIRGCGKLAKQLKTDISGIESFSQAIMTTDQFPKWAAVKVDGITLLGFAKGAGMIEPSMATMLAYFVTDADIKKTTLNKTFKEVCDLSFNAITVDGDTSTSDTALILANGKSDKVNPERFKKALLKLAQFLAKEIVRDGEGTSKVIELKITRINNLKIADLIAKSILNSPLVKTAIFGSDPNWGRIIMAIGKVGKYLKPQDKILFEKIKIYSLNKEEKILLNQMDIDEQINRKRLKQLKKHFKHKQINLEIEINNGEKSKTYWGCDLNENYIRLNADYTT